jgi:predicted ATP-grasp superfamily ATP-dependent carboligase
MDSNIPPGGRKPETVSILLSEGSSLSARQAVTALGPLGYRIGVCDPDSACIGRFSAFVRRFYRCPTWSRNPQDYLNFILGRLEKDSYDVLLPVHEQAFLFSAAKDRLASKVGIAITEFSNFTLLQSKAAFARLLADLGLPYPGTSFVNSRSQLEGMSHFPYYVKTPYSTAGSGVWRIDNAEDRAAAMTALKKQGLFDGKTDVLVQDVAAGILSQAQAVFEHGRLVASHCTCQQAEGIGGSQSARLSVDHSVVRRHLEILGRHLGWHGALALDYLFDPSTGEPSYIEANPRLVEPMNAVMSGVNLPEILVRLSLGESLAAEPVRIGLFGVRTHSLLATLLGLADRGESRLRLITEAFRAILKRGPYACSMEDLTPVTIDWQSFIPLAFVGVQLLINQARAKQIAGHAVSTYALTQEAAEEITKPEMSLKKQ